MIQSAARSGIDFTTADLRDRLWWLRTAWITGQIEDDNAFELTMRQHAQHLAVLSYSLPKDTFDTHWDAANGLLQNMATMKFPWMKGSKTDKRKSASDALMEQWRAMYGDMSDPAVRQHFNEVAAKMRERRLKAAAERAAKPSHNAALKESLRKRKGRSK